VAQCPRRRLLLTGSPEPQRSTTRLGERPAKRLVQKRDLHTEAAGVEQLGQLARLGTIENDGRVRLQAAVEEEREVAPALDRPRLRP